MSTGKKLTVAYKVVVETGERSSATFGWVSNRTTGVEISKGKGWFGSNGIVAEKPTQMYEFEVNGEKYHFPANSRVTIYNSVEHYEAGQMQRKRELAFEKLRSALTEEEIKLIFDR